MSPPSEAVMFFCLNNFLAEEVLESFFHLGGLDEFYFEVFGADALEVVARYYHGVEAQLLGLGDALLYACDLPQLTAQAHLGTEAHALLDGDVNIRRQDGAYHRQVEGRVAHLEAAGDVEEHVFLRQLEPHPLLEHRQ